MRIISGSARGRKLVPPAATNKAIRPTSDRAREALFNIIGARVDGARVLDLFAGTGAIGCEALSRGAEHVCFVERSKTALELIRKNVALIPDGAARTLLVRHDLSKGLLPGYHAAASPGSFDLVFADPPYRTDLCRKILYFLDSSPVLSERALVIVEKTKSVELPATLANLNLDSTRRYGDTSFAFYRRPAR